jgi:uncharacterized protein DUF6644
MNLAAICKWLDDTQLATAIREWPGLFASIETVHVIALVQVVGSIFLIDLRLLGLASRKHPVRETIGEILPYTWTGFVVAAISGALMFTSKATQYYENFSFRMKMLLLAIAGINMLAFHLWTYRRVAAWDRGTTTLGAKFAGGLSIALWIGIVTFGRWIGFTVLPI